MYGSVGCARDPPISLIFCVVTSVPNGKHMILETPLDFTLQSLCKI